MPTRSAAEPQYRAQAPTALGSKVVPGAAGGRSPPRASFGPAPRALLPGRLRRPRHLGLYSPARGGGWWEPRWRQLVFERDKQVPSPSFPPPRGAVPAGDAPGSAVASLGRSAWSGRRTSRRVIQFPAQREPLLFGVVREEMPLSESSAARRGAGPGFCRGRWVWSCSVFPPPPSLGGRRDTPRRVAVPLCVAPLGLCLAWFSSPSLNVESFVFLHSHPS